MGFERVIKMIGSLPHEFIFFNFIPIKIRYVFCLIKCKNFEDIVKKIKNN